MSTYKKTFLITVVIVAECVFAGNVDQFDLEQWKKGQNERKIYYALCKEVATWLSDANETAGANSEKLADSLLTLPEPSANAYFRASLVANLHKKPDKAITILEEVIKKYPEDKAVGTSFPVKIVAPFWIATIAKQSGDILKAQKTYETILSNLTSLEGKEILTMICNLYLAEIESNNLKSNTDALKRLNALENISKPEKNWVTWYDMFSSWTKYNSNEISQGKNQAIQKLMPHTQITSSYIWAGNQMNLIGISGEPLASYGKEMNVVTETLVNRAIQSKASQIDRDIAGIGYGYDQQYKGNLAKAEEYYLSLFQDESFFSPIAGISLARVKKAQNNTEEANKILDQVSKKYPGYESLANQTRQSLK